MRPGVCASVGEAAIVTSSGQPYLGAGSAVAQEFELPAATQAARQDLMAGKITAEEFLAKVGTRINGDVAN